jgi:hypothetical protein
MALAERARRHPAMVVAIAALVFSLIGTATASRVLVREKTTKVVVREVAPAAAPAAKKKAKARPGPRGPAGPQGLQGPQGLPGTAGAPGSDQPGIMTGQGTSLPTTAGTVYLEPHGSSAPSIEILAEHLTPAGSQIGVRDLAIALNIPPGAGDSRTFTIRANSADTAVTCSVSGLTNSCTSMGLTDTISGSTRISLEVTSTGTPSATEVNFGWRTTAP